MTATTLVAWLIPPGLEPWAALTLIGVSLLTSALTAALSLGGGVALLAVMATMMPAAAIIPVHGVVQFGSNAGRAVLLRTAANRRIMIWFTLGSIVGIAAAAPLVIELPGWGLKLALGLFILYSTWAPRPKIRDPSPKTFALTGAVASFLTMFLGATGPFIAAILSQQHLARQAIVGTHAVCMTIQHGFKIVAFGLLGFAFGPWLPLIAAMIAAGFLGTIAGTGILKRLPEARFRAAFRLLLTALATNLIASSLGLY